MRKIALLLALLPCAVYADSWSREDIYRQSLFVGLQAVDYFQTRYIAKSEDYSESNVILGENPDVNDVVRYNVAMIVGNTLITHLLPSRYRKNWQYLTIGIELQAVVHNTSIGVKLDF